MVDRDWLVIRWHVDDVLQEAENNGYLNLTREDARDILEAIEASHDATIGVNWDVIRWAIEDHLENKEGV